jgi:tRNA A-37 threonylcarbamoyl transferase component Bud32
MHKDVKTDNFCMNEEQDRITSIYAIDYGFSRPAFGEELMSCKQQWQLMPLRCLS